MKISVVVPVYGVEKYIAHCARSLFAQQGADLEFVFVNDATRDRSIDILNELIDNEYPALRSQVLIIDKGVNEGLPRARKTGVEAATGDYIMFCDADDWFEPNAIERVAEALAVTASDVVCFNHFEASGDHRTLVRLDAHESTLDYVSEMMSHSPGAPAYCWDKVVRRSLFATVVEWPVWSMHEDMGLMPQVVYAARSLCFIDEALYNYRCDSSSSMSQDFGVNRERRRQSMENQLLLIRFIERNGLQSALRRPYQQLIVRCAYLAVYFCTPDEQPDYDFAAALCHCPYFFGIDVSPRRQLVTRLTLRWRQWRHRLRGA